MGRIDIVNFSILNEDDAETCFRDLGEIFFETSIKKEFRTSLHKSEYYQAWLGFYLAAYPGFTLLAVLDGRCVGYMVGVPDSSMETHLFKVNPAYKVFCDLYEKYPAHLHINCHPDFQGKGIGTLLTKSFFDILMERNVCGVHIITAPDARNVSFYKKMDFSFEIIRRVQNKELLFMARGL